jgi:hypothetical protein
MSKKSTCPVMLELSKETYVECKAIAEKNSVSTEVICAEFVEFALQLYKEGKMKERDSEDSVFNHREESELVN